MRGRAALAHVDVRDGERTVLRVERAAATGLDIEWPGRIAVAHLGLEAPWILMERDTQGGMAIRELLPPTANGAASPAPSGEGPPARPLAVTIGLLTVEEGGARVVDHSIAPQFALDLRRLAGRAEGIRTTPGPEAHIDLTGQAGPGTVLALRGTVRPVGEPLVLDLRGELRELTLPARTRTWCPISRGRPPRGCDGPHRGSRSGRGPERPGRCPAEPTPGRPRGTGRGSARCRAGLPLNLILALMRDSRGDIRMSVPGGRPAQRPAVRLP